MPDLNVSVLTFLWTDLYSYPFNEIMQHSLEYCQSFSSVVINEYRQVHVSFFHIQVNYKLSSLCIQSSVLFTHFTFNCQDAWPFVFAVNVCRLFWVTYKLQKKINSYPVFSCEIHTRPSHHPTKPRLFLSQSELASFFTLKLKKAINKPIIRLCVSAIKWLTFITDTVNCL